MKRVRLLVCGGRDYNDYIKLNMVMNHVKQRIEIVEIIHGGAKGADSMVGYWAETNCIPVTVVPAEWSLFKCAAGMIRNKKMLDMKPDGVIAFPGGNGTKNMVSIAKKANIPVLEIDRTTNF